MWEICVKTPSAYNGSDDQHLNCADYFLLWLRNNWFFISSGPADYYCSSNYLHQIPHILLLLKAPWTEAGVRK